MVDNIAELMEREAEKQRERKLAIYNCVKVLKQMCIPLAAKEKLGTLESHERIKLDQIDKTIERGERGLREFK